MASLRRQLTEALAGLEARVAAADPSVRSGRGPAGTAFILALGFRTKAVKPVERLSARLAHARSAAALLDRVEATLALGSTSVVLPSAVGTRVRRRVPSGR